MRPRLPVSIAASLLALALVSATSVAHEDPRREIAELSRRLTASPEDVALRLRRAELLRLSGEWASAEADLDAVLTLGPNAPARLQRGALELDRGHPAEALSWIDAYVAERPRDADGRRLRASALRALDRPAEAVSELDAALRDARRVTPGDYLARAELQHAAGARDEAVLQGLDEGLARLGEAVSLELAAIEVELGLGRGDPALARLDRIAPHYGRREVVLERRGAILAAVGRGEEAREAYAAALAELASLDTSRRTLATQALEARVREALASLAPSRGGAR